MDHFNDSNSRGCRPRECSFDASIPSKPLTSAAKAENNSFVAPRERERAWCCSCASSIPPCVENVWAATSRFPLGSSWSRRAEERENKKQQQQISLIRVPQILVAQGYFSFFSRAYKFPFGVISGNEKKTIFCSRTSAITTAITDR